MPRDHHYTSYYDTMQVCTAGHMITSHCRHHPEDMKKRCSKCGSVTITKCQSCDAEIQGYENIPGVAHMGPDAPPAYCHECGEPYPWTQSQEPETESSSKMDDNQPKTLNVFIVHGHDEEMKQSVARVLGQLGLNPIILHEQPNGGRTVIEKFERNADVGFAIALLSPDDMGYLSNGDAANAVPRARQNVILELGYFVGALGRDKVVALKRGDTEIPSDFNGVVYTPYDQNGHWRFELVKELKEAGFSVDANSLL